MIKGGQPALSNRFSQATSVFQAGFLCIKRLREEAGPFPGLFLAFEEGFLWVRFKARVEYKYKTGIKQNPA